jgi:hypothetical protein
MVTVVAALSAVNMVRYLTSTDATGRRLGTTLETIKSGGLVLFPSGRVGLLVVLLKSGPRFVREALFTALGVALAR